MRDKTKITRIIIAVLLMASTAMFAHHTSAGLFSVKVDKTLKGTVQKWIYVNPHAALVIDVKNDAGETETWRAEFTSPGGLKSCCDITRLTFKPGDPITIVGHPYFNNIKTMDAIKVIFPNGKEVAVRSSAEPEYETGK
jgi:hypothetical protein